MKKTVSVIIYCLFALTVLAGVIGGVLYLSNGGKTNVRTFNVLLNGELVDNQTITMRDDNTPVVFNIESLISDKTPSVKVRAVPNANAEKVNILVDEKPYRLSACKDFTGLFNIEYFDNTISISSGFDFQSYLKNYFASESNAVVKGLTKQSYITLIFASGKVEIKCNVVKFTTVKDVALDSDSIVIG